MAQEDESRDPQGEPTPSPPQQPSSPWKGWNLVQVLAVAAFALAVSSAVMFGLSPGLGGSGGGDGSSAPAVRENGGEGGSAPFDPGSGPAPGGGSTKRTASLSIAIDGEGSGTVTSDPPGIECSVDCEEKLPRTLVRLRASPTKGSVFAGFSGDCSGTDPCMVLLDVAASVTATFELD
jgi:hypothetical protein